MADLDELITLREKQVDLLKELRESKKYEQCTHDVRELPGRTGFFMVFDISTSQIVIEGSATRCRSKIEMRKIPVEKVYGYEKIEAPAEPRSHEPTGNKYRGNSMNPCWPGPVYPSVLH